MTYQEAKAFKNKDSFVEYQLRSARIVDWLIDSKELDPSDAESFFVDLWNDFFKFDESNFDNFALRKAKKLAIAKAKLLAKVK